MRTMIDFFMIVLFFMGFGTDADLSYTYEEDGGGIRGTGEE